jgi:two-component system cell cycle sensor histidine kinase/response regulator CckA
MEHILVVDDEEGITMVVKAALTRENYTVITARNGRDALEKLALGPVDMVITDMIMPDIDGLHLIQEIRQQLPRVRIIAMSGGSERFGSDPYLKEARRLGATQILGKPFLMNELIELVKRMLAEGPKEEVDM